MIPKVKVPKKWKAKSLALLRIMQAIEPFSREDKRQLIQLISEMYGIDVRKRSK